MERVEKSSLRTQSSHGLRVHQRRHYPGRRVSYHLFEDWSTSREVMSLLGAEQNSPRTCWMIFRLRQGLFELLENRRTQYSLSVMMLIFCLASAEGTNESRPSERVI